MFGLSMFTLLLILWAAVTLVFIALIIYRSFAGMREADQIFLDPAEAKMEEEQRQIVARVERISTYVRGFGIASLALLLVIAGVWIYRGLTTFTHPPMP